MRKICINSRDELCIIDLEKIAYLQADGNYTRIVYINNQRAVVSLGITNIKEIIEQAQGAIENPRFIRLGRSIIINHNYLFSLNVLKQKIILSDGSQNMAIPLSISKNLLKEYKRLITSK